MNLKLGTKLGTRFLIFRIRALPPPWANPPDNCLAISPPMFEPHPKLQG
jgi:hypothetical protein